MLRSSAVCRGLAAGTSFVSLMTMLAAPAAAQESAREPAASSSGSSAAGQAEDATSGQAQRDIVVTGSRTITDGNNSPTPVTVLAVETLDRTTPTNIPDALNKLPILAQSGSERTGNNSAENGVGNYLNLRGLGSLRTLILFDGRRMTPTAADGQVDANTIPQLLIKRVDIVTGGASAVYGSDAVTGVINFVVDNKYNGIEARAQAGISSRGDRPTQRLGLVAGTDLFGGRGHIAGSYEYYNSDGIDMLSRDIGRRVFGLAGTGTAANPFRLYENVRINITSRVGLINTGPMKDFVFDGGGLRPFVHGTPTGTSTVEIGGDGDFAQTNLFASLESHQGFLRFDYELSDNLRLRLQGAASKAYNQNDVNILTYRLTLSTENAFLTDAQRTALSTGGATTFGFAKRRHLDPYDVQARIDSYHVTVGLDGDFGSKFKWDLAYSRSSSKQEVLLPNNVRTTKLAAAADAVRAPDGSIVCRVTLTHPGLYPGCVPINLFGLGSESPEAYNYITQQTGFETTSILDNVTANITGSPFSTWAGEVRFALTGEYRRNTLRTTTNAEPTARNDCTGLILNCNSSTLTYTTNIVASASGEQEVYEGALEVNIPLLRDFALANELSVNGAARIAEYSTTGSAFTWKVGLDWHVTDDFRVRATRSRDMRSPTLTDLFGALSVSSTGYTDLHTGIARSTPIASQGNPLVKPEFADTLTAGVVYRPNFVPALSIAVDYYQVKIRDAIAIVSATDASIQQLCEDSNGTSSVCVLFERPLPFSDRSPANFPTLIRRGPVNVSRLDQSGVDGELNYSTELGGGRLGLRGLVSYTIKQNVQQIVGAPVVKWAGVGGYHRGFGLPKWKAVGFINYEHSGFEVDWMARWRSSLKFNGNPALVFDTPIVRPVLYNDISLAYTVGDRPGMRFFVSVQNVFDKESDPFTTTGVISVPNYNYPVASSDDVIGRYFTAGVRAKF